MKRSTEVNVAHVLKYPAPVRCLKFSSDGKYLAIGLQWNGKTHIYDMQTKKEKWSAHLFHHQQPRLTFYISVLADYSKKDHQVCVWAVDFSPDNKYIATGSNNQICVGLTPLCLPEIEFLFCQIWEIEQRRLWAMFKHHKGDVFSLTFSPDGHFLVSGSYDDSVRIWRLRDGWSLELLDNALGYFSVCFSPDGQHIAAANSDKTLRLWHTRTGKLVDKWSAHTESAYCVAFTSDGKGLVSGSKTIKYWDITSIATAYPIASEVGSNPRKEVYKLEGHTVGIHYFDLHALTVVRFLSNCRRRFGLSLFCQTGYHSSPVQMITAYGFGMLLTQLDGSARYRVMNIVLQPLIVALEVIWQVAVWTVKSYFGNMKESDPEWTNMLTRKHSIGVASIHLVFILRHKINCPNSRVAISRSSLQSLGKWSIIPCAETQQSARFHL